MISRRRFLSGATTFLGLPLLGTPLARAAAPALRPAKRFIAVYSSNGQPRNLWFPTADIPFQNIDGALDARVGKLSDLPGASMSPTLVPELNRFRDKLVLVRGLDLMQCAAWGHYAPKMLNAWPIQGQYRRTIDQVMAHSRTLYPGATTHRSVHLLAQGPQSMEDPISVAEVDGVTSLVYGQLHADETFRRLFASPTYADVGDTARVTSERRIMDRVRERYRALSQDPRLGAGDRYRLAAHATMIDDLERRLMTPSVQPSGCIPPTSPVRFPHTDDNMAQITRDQIEVLAASIRCGLTRVATLQLCSSTDNRTYPDAEGGPFDVGHHILTHTAGPQIESNLGSINRSFARSFARLLELLDVVEEPDTGRTYLDNSIVYWGNEFGTNYDHMSSGFPVLIAGGKDVLRTGRYLDYRRTGLRFLARGPHASTLYEDDGGYEWRGRPYNQLLVSFLLAMGLSPDEWEPPGEPGYGDYSDNEGEAYIIPDRREPLPGLLV